MRAPHFKIAPQLGSLEADTSLVAVEQTAKEEESGQGRFQQDGAHRCTCFWIHYDQGDQVGGV